MMTLVLTAWSAQAATYYGFKIGGVAVNSDNYNNVTGSTISGSVTYDPTTNTVTLNNVTISRTGSDNRCIYNESNNGLTVILQGTNNLSARDAAPVRLDSGVGMTMNVYGNTTISSENEEAIYANSNSNYRLYIKVFGNGKLNVASNNKAGIASGSTCNLSLDGAIDINGKKGAIDWDNQVNIYNTEGKTGITLHATNNSSYPVFKAGTLNLYNGNGIIQPAGAVWNASQGTITLNGSAIYNHDIIIGKDCALLINSTNFPDTKFRNYLLGQYPKGFLNSTELANLTELHVSSMGIYNMTGVKLLTNLVELACASNYLTSLDVSGLTKLKYLTCNGNSNLTSLNTTNCTALTDIYCFNTAITSLNLTTNTALETLNCSKTNLTELRVPNMSKLDYLNVSNCTSLQQLYCNNCPLLDQLDLTGCSALENLYCQECNLSSMDKLQYLSNLVIVNCMGNKLSSFTLSNKSRLTHLYLQDMPTLATVTVINNPALIHLDCSNCTALVNLNATNNNLTNLFVTGSRAIRELRCFSNAQLKSISGLDNCVALTYIDCEGCAITSLTGLQNANNITWIAARNNKLTSFSITEKSKLKTLKVSNNPSLTSLYCYKNALTTLQVEGCTSLGTLSCYKNPELATITGLADCVNLTKLYLSSCAFSSLNLSDKNKLTTLDCGSNNLTSLNLTGCSALKELLCDNNSDLSAITGLASCQAITTFNCNNCSFTNLDAVNGMGNISLLSASNNQLTSLEITNKSNLKTILVKNNPTLTTLNCFYNDLTTLNITGCTGLTHLRCYNNENLSAITGLNNSRGLIYLDCEDCAITSLNGVQNMTELQKLLASNNSLTQLDVTGCTTLNTIKCYKNQISGEGMTTLVNSLPLRSEDNPGYLYAIFNTDEGNTMNAEQIAFATNKHWMPKKYNGSSWDDMTAVLRGDVNSDTNVDITDAIILINFILNGNETGINFEASNVNNDSGVDITDAIILINFILNGNW